MTHNLTLKISNISACLHPHRKKLTRKAIPFPYAIEDSDISLMSFWKNQAKELLICCVGLHLFLLILV